MIKTVYKQTLMSHVVNVSVLAACMWRKRPSFFFFCVGVYTAVCLTLEVCSNRYTMNSKHSYLCVCVSVYFLLQDLFGFTETRFVRFCEDMRCNGRG